MNLDFRGAERYRVLGEERIGVQFCLAQQLQQPHSCIKSVIETVPTFAEAYVTAEFARERRLGLFDFRFDVRVAGFPHNGFAARLADNAL